MKSLYTNAESLFVRILLLGFMILLIILLIENRGDLLYLQSQLGW